MEDEAKKEAAKVEIAKLIAEFENNRDYYEKTDEANIETKLIEPMFAALGWTKDDFEKREKVRRKDRRGITDYTFKLHGKSVFVLEAKKVKVEVDWDEGTWKQAISYTFSKKVSFSVLTNFKSLLIFCTDDEKAMSPFRVLKYTDYLSSRFEDLWILSKDSFEQNLIFDRATSEGRMKKRRTIDDKLLEDLISSRKKIVESIERNYGGKYTTLEKDDIAQRIFGRLIFIRKCEDKQINFDNDGKEIEMLKEVTALPHSGAYPKLKKIFTKYNDVFNSGLFIKDVDSDVDRIEIDGKVIKELIHNTYESKDGNYVYNFEWIDADVLGNIYEQYLGHILKETTKQTRITESHAHRKEQGIYYTPTEIVKYIVDNTLGEMLKKKKPEEIKKLRILDPACGSGSFLIKAFDVLEDYYEKNIEEKQLKFDSSGDFYSIKEQVLTNNIFGVDLDHKAVEIAQLNLLLKLAEKGHRLPLLQKNIQNGNSLIDDEAIAGDNAFKWEERFFEIMNEGRFDVVIGNPPYIAWDKVNRGERKRFEKGKYLGIEYACRPNHADSQPNYYLFFIARASRLLKKNGVLSFIIPQEWLYHNYAQDFRDYILEEFERIEIVQFNPNYKVFRSLTETVGTNSLIIILHKKGNGIEWKRIDSLNENEVEMKLSIGSFDRVQSKTKKELYNNIWTFSEARFDKIKKKIKSCDDVVCLKDPNYFEVKGGFQPPIDESKIFEIEKDVYDALPIVEKEIAFNLIYDAGEIKRYYFASESKRYWIVANIVSSEEELKLKYPKIYSILSKRIQNKKKNWWHFPNIRNFELIASYPTKLLSPRTASRPSFVLDNDRSVFKGTNTMVISKTDSVPIKFLLGVLNSGLSEFWYSKFGYEYHGGKTKKYEPEKCRKYSIPIKIASDTDKKKISVLVDRMLSLNKRLNEIGDKKTDQSHKIGEEIQKTDAEIDDLVYELYGITEEEKKIIEESLK